MHFFVSIGCFAKLILSRFLELFIFVQSLENSLDGQFKVIHGDFFRLDPLAKGALKPPAVSSDKLFETMGVAAVPWRAGRYMLMITHVTNMCLKGA